MSLSIWILQHQLCLLYQGFTMHCVTKTIPVHFIDGKCHNYNKTIKLKISRTGLTG